MIEIIKMDKQHKAEVLDMMRVFYNSSAVATNGSDEIFENDINACLSDSPYLEGYVLLFGDIVAGYGMIAKSFSTEYGKPCIWIEDIYLKPEFQGMSGGSKFLKFIENKYKDALLRLEVEDYNTRAVHVYEKSGFTTMPYMEMKKGC